MHQRDEIELHTQRLAAATTWYDCFVVMCSITDDMLEEVAHGLSDDDSSIKYILARAAVHTRGNRAVGFLVIEDQEPEQPALQLLIEASFNHLASADPEALPLAIHLVHNCAELASHLSVTTGLLALELSCAAWHLRPTVRLLDYGFHLAGAIRRDPDREAEYLNLTAVLLQSRYQTSWVRADLEQAVKLGAAALQHGNRNGPDWAILLSRQGSRLRLLYEATGEATDLEQAIALGEEALTRLPPSGANRPSVESGLATLLVRRYEVSGVRADLDRAVELGADALACAPASGPSRAAYLSNQAGHLLSRYHAGGGRTDLDLSITLGAQALSHFVAPGLIRAGLLSNQANRLKARYQANGDRADLYMAIELGVEALSYAPSIGPERAALLSNQGLLFQVLYDSTRRDSDLEQAIRLGAEALIHAPVAGPDRARYLSHQANVLKHRYDTARQDCDFEQAIELGSEALVHAPAAGAERAMYQGNQAGRLWRHYLLTGQEAELQAAIKLGAEALDHSPTTGPDRAALLSGQAGRLHTRYEMSGDHTDLESVAALATQWASIVMSDGGTQDGIIGNARWWMGRLGHLADQGLISWDCVAATGRGLLTRAATYAGMPETGVNYSDVERDLQAVGVRVAVDGVMGLTALAYLRIGNPKAAIEVLEDGAATVAQDQASRIPWEVASRTVPEVADHARDLQASILHATAPEALAAIQHAYAEAVTELRQVLAIPTVTPVAVQELSRRSTGPLVWIVATAEGGFALRLDQRGEIDHLELAALNSRTIDAWHSRLHPCLPEAEGRCGIRPPVRRNSRRAPMARDAPAVVEVAAVVDELAETLGEVGTWLEGTGTVLVPVGLLGGLPWQSLHSRLRLHVTAAQATRPPRPVEPGNIVVYADADANDHLPAAREEAAVLAEKHCAVTMIGDMATLDSLAATDSCRILHLALHGTPDPAIWFADGPLTLGNVHLLRHLWGTLELFFLNCCTSAATLEGVRDESLGFAAIAMTGGAQAALVALWPVDDEPARSFATEYYLRLSEGEGVYEALSAARAQTVEWHPDSSTAHAYQLLS